MDQTSARVTVAVEPGDDDPELAGQLAWNLQQELESYAALTSIERPPPTDRPDGAKGIADPAVLDLIVTLSSAGLTGLVAVLVAWLKRSQARRIVLQDEHGRKLVLEASTRDDRELAEKWIERMLDESRSE